MRLLEAALTATVGYGSQALAGYEICAIAHQRLDWKPGDALKLSPVIDRVHLFDAETKVALPAG